MLADGLNVVAVVRVLLIFGLLWWMYEGYAWLTNARPPVHATERLSLLAGMAGFLIVGLAIPRGFGGDGVTLGLGYLLVVVVHTFLYYRVNANIIRVAPFNICSALLIIVAGLAGRRGPSTPLWVAALVIQLGSPLIVHPGACLSCGPLTWRNGTARCSSSRWASRWRRSASAPPCWPGTGG